MSYAHGYCGMPCALCTRYRTEGVSRCPGCSHDGYYTDGCKAHGCCRARALAHCGACCEYPCEKLGRMSDFKDLNTHHAKRRACARVAADGFDAWYKEYAERADLLTEALARYNDGRMKRYLCELFIARDIGTLRAVMRRAEAIQANDKKAAGRAFKALVKDMDESLRLRPFEDGDMDVFKHWLYAPHVAKWYEHPQSWIDEIQKRRGEFAFIKHFIVEYGGAPIAFCQYYDYAAGGEDWHGDLDIKGAYSLDYMIGEASHVGGGLGTRIVKALVEKIREIDGARIVIVNPEADNLPSCGALRASGFTFVPEIKGYRLELNE